MKQNEKPDKLSISEMLKRIQEQADSLPDDGEEMAEPIEDEMPETVEIPTVSDSLAEEHVKPSRYHFRIVKQKHVDDAAQTAEVPAVIPLIDTSASEVQPDGTAFEEETFFGENMPTAEVELPSRNSARGGAADAEVIADMGEEEAAFAANDLPSQTDAASACEETDAETIAALDSGKPEDDDGRLAAVHTDDALDELFVPEPIDGVTDGEEESDSDSDWPADGKTHEFDAIAGEDAAQGDQTRMKQYMTDEEYERFARPRDLSEIEEMIAEEAVRDSFMPHGAEAQRQDTGDVTYVFEQRDDDALDVEEQLVPPEVDETDVNLMIAFGMDDELAKTIDQGRREQVEQEISEMEREMEEPEEQAFEYTSSKQNKAIFNDYRKKYGGVTLRIAACAVLLLIAFLYENISTFGGTLADAINPALYPVTHIMIDLQLVLVGGILIGKRIWQGMKSLLRFSPTPDSVIALLMTLTVAYDIGMCFLPYGTVPQLYGFPMLFGVMVSLVYEMFNLRREIFSFNIVASKRIKFTIGRLEADRSALEEEAFREYLPEDPSIFKLNKAAFIDGFYARMRPSGSSKRILTLLLIFGLTMTAAIAGLGALWTGNLVSGIGIGYAALMMSMPIAVYLTYSLPFYRASQIAYEQDSAILGESAIDEYADASSITFDDRDVFPSYGVKVRSIKVFGNNRIDSIIYNAASVFRIAGGPLADVFDIATAELGHSEDVRLLAVEPDGIEAVVSGTHLYFGKDEYLRRHGFTPLVDDDDGQIGSASIMYMVSDDEVAAKMYIQYRIDADFENTLKQLYRYGICIGIKTLDPNIDDEMLSRRIKLDKYPVRILKCRETEDHTKVLEHAQSGLVSKHSAKALLRAFTLCAKVQRMIRLDAVINVIAMLAGVFLMLMTLVFDAAEQIPSVYIALYQLFWAVPMYVMAKMMIK